MYNSPNDNSVINWLTNNQNYYNYDHLPHLLKNLFDVSLKIDYDYEFRILNICVLNYLNIFTEYHKLKTDFELVEPYYEQCFSYKRSKIYQNKNQYIDILLFLNGFTEGQQFLDKHHINFRQHGKFRELAFEKTLQSIFLTTNDLEQFCPKNINHKELLERKNSIAMCNFLNNHGFEIPKKYLVELIINLYNSFILDGQNYSKDTFNRLDKTKYIEKFSELLLNNASFRNYIAPIKDIHVGMYNYFEKIFPIPKDLNFTQDDLKTATNRKIYFLNQFSKKLFNYPGYRYLNINTKLHQQINFKYSGKKFVSPEEQEENILLEKEKTTTKNNKINKI